jgi:hypothetical protein
MRGRTVLGHESCCRERCSQKEATVTKRLRVRFFDSLPDEGLLALANHRLEDLPEPWRHEAECSVVVRRDKPDGSRAVHHVEVDFDRGPETARVYAASSDTDPYAALSRAFDSARASIVGSATT